MAKLEAQRFEVTSWYHDFPSDFNLPLLPNPLFAINVLKHQKTQEPIGVRIKWSFKIDGPKHTVLNFVAIDDYLSLSVRDLTIADMQATVRVSHLKFRKEFDKIKVGFEISFSIPPYQENDINYQDLLNLLQ